MVDCSRSVVALSARRAAPRGTILILAVCAVVAGARSAAAQVVGYGVAGPAFVSGFFNTTGLHAAGGVEVLAGGRAGAGGEFGILANSSSVLLTTSVNGAFYFTDIGTRRLSPFVTGGYTHLSSGEGSFDAWNIGAGVDVWKEHVGFRLDARDHIRPDRRGTVHYFTIRAGVSFR